MNVFKRSKKGFALILVILIAALMMIPVLMLISSAIPRRTNVVGEAVSDRSLVLADSTVDHILDTINTFPFTFTTPTIIDPDTGNLDLVTKKAQDYLISYYISQLNGGVPDITDPIGSYDLISGYGSTYLYNLDTQEYYAVWDSTITLDFPNGHIANVSAVGPDGSIAQTGNVKNLSTNVVSSLPFTNVDTDYKTDNLWVEIDTNTKYWPGEPDKWIITTTAYLISKPEIKRTIQAVASRGKVTPTGSLEELANGNWYTFETSEEYTTVYYSDFSGLYHTRVYFGRFETTRGMIRGDENVWMGGWAEDPVYAHGTVTDQAIDDGNRHDGKFGPDKNNLTWAKANGYATDGYPAATWPNGDLALKGSQGYRNGVDPNGGLQDRALDEYYVNGNATIVFSVDVNGVGWVTINGNKLPMPPNGAIYIEGNATISGKVEGRCTVGAGGNINIGGNIVYNTPPRVDKDTIIEEVPDSLGLIAYSNIVIPTSTFNANHHLQIDAAMLAVHGWFGIDSSAPWHTINGSGEYEAWWNGCQAMWSTSNAPAIVSGSSVKGYDIQHTYFDWNLYDFGPPPYYPATNSRSDLQLTERYVVVSNPTLQGILRALHKSDLTPNTGGDPAYPWKYEYGGVTYYYGDTFNLTASATATMQNTALYRITWKEQIAKPVESINP